MSQAAAPACANASATTASPASPPSMLAKRRIEAEVLGHVYAVLKASQGQAVAMQVVGDAVRRSAIAQAEQFAAASAEPPSLQRFVALSRLWEADDALRIEVVQQSAQQYDFKVTRCRYAEMYREMGLGEIGHLLSCQRDGSFSEGFDAKLHFARSQTLMQGASHCDFHYRYDESVEPSEPA